MSSPNAGRPDSKSGPQSSDKTMTSSTPASSPASQVSASTSAPFGRMSDKQYRAHLARASQDSPDSSDSEEDSGHELSDHEDDDAPLEESEGQRRRPQALRRTGFALLLLSHHWVREGSLVLSPPSSRAMGPLRPPGPQVLKKRSTMLLLARPAPSSQRCPKKL